MTPWEQWKKGFDAWESTTAKYAEQWVKSPAVLEPSGALLSAVMKVKAKADEATAAWWGAWGLPTKRDQERSLHALHELQGRVIDLEEQLARLTPRKRG